MGIWSAIAAPLVGGAAGIVGGAIDHVLNRDITESVNQENLHWSRRAIRDRVRDAKLAGIHPLYALGASTSTPSFQIGEPSRIGEEVSRMGQNIGDSVGRALDSDMRMRAKLENIMLEKQIAKTEAERRLVEQEGLRVMQNNTGGGGGSIQMDRGPGGQPVIPGQQGSGLYNVNPGNRSTSVPGFPEIQAGPDQTVRKHYLPGGLPIYLPYSDEGPAETLESIPVWMLPGIYLMNKNIFGEEYGQALFNLISRGEIPQRREYRENWNPGPRSPRGYKRNHPVFDFFNR